jgi:hypothetical protein
MTNDRTHQRLVVGQSQESGDQQQVDQEIDGRRHQRRMKLVSAEPCRVAAEWLGSQFGIDQPRAGHAQGVLTQVERDLQQGSVLAYLLEQQCAGLHDQGQPQRAGDDERDRERAGERVLPEVVAPPDTCRQQLPSDDASNQKGSDSETLRCPGRPTRPNQRPGGNHQSSGDDHPHKTVQVLVWAHVTGLLRRIKATAPIWASHVFAYGDSQA